MKLNRKVGATSEIWQIFIADSSSTTGAGLTGLVYNSAGLTAYYHRDTDTTATAISLETMTVGTFTSSGFKEIDATNMPGWYQFCPPNAALASGAKSCAFHLKGATNMAPLPIEVDLNAEVNVTHWNGTAVSSPATAGIPDVNIKNINNVAAATPGAAGGLFIAGSNAATTVASLTSTGTFTISDGLVVTRSTSDQSAIVATGNGSGAGFFAQGGSGGGAGADFRGGGAGAGFYAFGGSGGGTGFEAIGGFDAPGGSFRGGATAPGGAGLYLEGGATSHGLWAFSGSGATGNGIQATAVSTNGSALSLTATGTGVGINTTGGANAIDTDITTQISTASWATVIEAGYTAADILQLLAAVNAGASTGGPGTPAYKGLDGTTTRVTGTVDANGNRSGLSLNVT